VVKKEKGESRGQKKEIEGSLEEKMVRVRRYDIYATFSFFRRFLDHSVPIETSHIQVLTSP
jgi:hypothetical protein